MHKILSDLLLKRKVDPKELSEAEKVDFDRWNSVLSGEEITVPKILEFCTRQKSAIELKWENVDNTVDKNERLIGMHTIYSKIIRMIQAEEAERIALEKHLTSLIDRP